MRVLIIILLVSLAPVLEAGTLSTALGSLSNPTMAGNAETVEGFSFDYGNATFTIDGEVEGVLGAERSIGFAFKGSGTMKITLADGPFQQANLTTLKDEVSGKSVANNVYTHEIEGGVFFTNEIPDGLFSGDHVTSSRLADIVDRSVERWGQTRYSGIDHLLVPFVLDDLDLPAAAAILWEGSDDAIFIYDPITDHQEVFGRLRKLSVANAPPFILSLDRQDDPARQVEDDK